MLLYTMSYDVLVILELKGIQDSRLPDYTNSCLQKFIENM